MRGAAQLEQRHASRSRHKLQMSSFAAVCLRKFVIIADPGLTWRCNGRILWSGMSPDNNILNFIPEPEFSEQAGGTRKAVQDEHRRSRAKITLQPNEDAGFVKQRRVECWTQTKCIMGLNRDVIEGKHIQAAIQRQMRQPQGCPRSLL